MICFSEAVARTRLAHTSPTEGLLDASVQNQEATHGKPAPRGATEDALPLFSLRFRGGREWGAGGSQQMVSSISTLLPKPEAPNQVSGEAQCGGRVL